MAEILSKESRENPREYMISAPVDLETKNHIIAIANKRFDGIEARALREAINRYIEDFRQG